MLLNLERCVLGVYEFNRLAGNYEDITKEKLIAQAKVVVEEAKELLQALENNEGEEQILKEAVDCSVVVTGFYQMLNHIGYDVFGAWHKVNQNNMTKFPDDIVKAKYSQSYYAADGVDVNIVQADDKLYVLKDKQGKVRKPIDYKKVELGKYVPSYKEEA